MKKTAANNRFLKAVKVIYNYKIFKRTSQILNDEGMDAAYTYFSQYAPPSIQGLNGRMAQVMGLIDWANQELARRKEGR